MNRSISSSPKEERQEYRSETQKEHRREVGKKRGLFSFLAVFRYLIFFASFSCVTRLTSFFCYNLLSSLLFSAPLSLQVHSFHSSWSERFSSCISFHERLEFPSRLISSEIRIRSEGLCFFFLPILLLCRISDAQQFQFLSPSNASSFSLLPLSINSAVFSCISCFLHLTSFFPLRDPYALHLLEKGFYAEGNASLFLSCYYFEALFLMSEKKRRFEFQLKFMFPCGSNDYTGETRGKKRSESRNVEKEEYNVAWKETNNLLSVSPVSLKVTEGKQDSACIAWCIL